MTNCLKICAIFLLSFPVFSQSITSKHVLVNDNSDAPDNSAALEVNSDDKGLLLPRMTSVQRTAIANPATGLLVFDTDANQFYYYFGGNWLPLSTGVMHWQEDGNKLYNTTDSVGIGTATPESRLEVAGTVTATAFDAGDASGLSKVYADSLRGSMQAETNDILQWKGANWAPISYGQYAFHTSASTDQTVVSKVFETLRTNNSSSVENFEKPAGVFDNASYAFIAPVDGIYFFEASVLWDNQNLAEVRNGIFIRVNNSDEVGSWSVSGGTDFFSTNVSTTLELNIGDEVRIRIYNDDISPMDTFSQAGKFCYFSGFLVFAQ